MSVFSSNTDNSGAEVFSVHVSLESIRSLAHTGCSVVNKHRCCNVILLLFCKLPIKFHSSSFSLDSVSGLLAKAWFMGILVIRITEVTRRAGRALPL